jgi:hypothetical protein
MAVQLNIVGNFDDKELKRAQDALTRLRNGADQASSGMRAKFAEIGGSAIDLGKKLSTMVTLPLLGLGVYGVKLAGELQDSQAMSEQVFGKWSKQLETWAGGASKNFGLAKGAALDASNQMGIRLRQIGGVTEESAAKTSTSLVQFAGDLASAFGGPVEDASTALQSALTGEYEPLKRYGIVINDAALQAEYFAETGHKVKGSLTAQQKQQATLGLIMKNGAIISGDYARNADGATNSQKTMTAQIKDAATAIGTILLPYATKLVQWVTDLVDKFKSLSPKWQKIIVIAGILAAVLGPLLIVLGSMATAVAAISWPVVLVVGLIAALVAGVIYAYKHFDGFRNVVDTVAKWLKEKLGQAFTWVKDTAIPALVSAFNWFKDNVLPKIVDFAKGAARAFMDMVRWVGDVISKAREIVMSFADWLNKWVVPVVKSAVDALSAAWKIYWAVTGPIFAAVVAVIKGAFDVIMVFVRVFVSMFVGLWNGLWAMVSGIVSAVWGGIKGGIQAALQFIRGILDIFTGIITGNWSRAWDGLKNVVGGAWNGIVSTIRMFVGIAQGVLSGLVSWIGSAFSGIGNMIVAPFRAAIGAFKSAWNSTIGGKGFSTPSWIPGIGGKEFRIPTLHQGGIVPGPMGQEVPTILQAGEAVLPIQAVRNLAAERQGGGTTYNITVNAGISDPAEVGRRVVDAVKSYERLNGAGWRAA